MNPGQAPVNQTANTLLFEARRAQAPTSYEWDNWAQRRIEPIEDET